MANNYEKYEQQRKEKVRKEKVAFDAFRSSRKWAKKGYCEDALNDLTEGHFRAGEIWREGSAKKLDHAIDQAFKTFHKHCPVPFKVVKK